MGLTLQQGSDFEIAPEGTHQAVCYRIIDLGTQPTTFDGSTKYQHKVLIQWEIHTDERMADGRPFSVGKKYTASLSSKAKLREHLKAWRGRDFTDEELQGFKMKNVLGAPCLIQVVHDTKGENTYANVGSIMKMPKGLDPVQAENPLVYFDLDAPDLKVFGSLSDKMQQMIAASPEWQEKDKKELAVADEELDSDIPF